MIKIKCHIRVVNVKLNINEIDHHTCDISFNTEFITNVSLKKLIKN